MKFRFHGGSAAALLSLAAVSAFGQTGFPFENETLHYSINWPSGLSLGDASFEARHTANGRWSFNVVLSASVPGFTVNDKYRSSATPELCSLELEREVAHGKKTGHETTTFDPTKMTAHRVTQGGGSSDFETSNCPRDAVTFLYYVRREMGQGRVAPASTIYLGSSYTARLEYTGAVTLKVADRPQITDRVVVSLKGPTLDINFEMFFARDPARTPLVIRVPLDTGALSMELVR